MGRGAGGAAQTASSRFPAAVTAVALVAPKRAGCARSAVPAEFGGSAVPAVAAQFSGSALPAELSGSAGQMGR
jgi:hypothetical protein